MDSVALAVLVGVVVALLFWLVRARRRGGAAEARPLGAGDRLPSEADEFLAAVDRNLGLHSEARAEVHAELADHLRDSIEAIEAEGLDRDRATREALARLGRPEELARQLREAHHTTRRLLAGAAGGVFQTGFGFVGGWFIGTVLVMLGLLAGTVLLNGLLKPVVDFLAAHLPSVSTDADDLATNSAYAGLAVCVAVFTAARQGVRAFSRYSQRPVRSVAPWWALTGALALAYLVLFVVTANQSWLTVLIELAIPVSFAAGALVKGKAGFRIPWARLGVAAMALTLIAVPALLIASSVSGAGQMSGGWSIDGLMRDYDRVAPQWEANTPAMETGGGGGCCYGIVFEDVGLDAAYVAQFHDIRFEAWRAVPWSGAPDWAEQYTVDPAFSGPYATAPANIAGSLTSQLDLRHTRTTRWLIFLTGIGPDGHRYRLIGPDQARSVFSGTVWDWLTAGS
jgi:hypothetical protein